MGLQSPQQWAAGQLGSMRKRMSKLLVGTALWEETTSWGPAWGFPLQVPEGPALDTALCAVGRTCCLTRSTPAPSCTPAPVPPSLVLTVGGSCPHCPGLLSPAALHTLHFTAPSSFASARRLGWAATGPLGCLYRWCLGGWAWPPSALLQPGPIGRAWGTRQDTRCETGQGWRHFRWEVRGPSSGLLVPARVRWAPWPLAPAGLVGNYLGPKGKHQPQGTEWPAPGPCLHISPVYRERTKTVPAT